MSTLRGIIEQPDRINVEQATHAALLVILPCLATVGAILLSIKRGFFLWELLVLGIMYLATMIGISLGLHRLFAHRTFEAKRGLRIALAVCGAMAAQGPPIYWATNHRRHHAYSDGPGDLHSPHKRGADSLHGIRGLWHAHIGWTFQHSLTNTAVFSKDLLQDRDLTIVNRYYYVWVLAGLIAPACVGLAVEGTLIGMLEGFLWGGGVRVFLSYHFISTINSILHVYGYRRFSTHESSRNNLWLALPTLGEAWHNNHHANANAANFSCAWWEFDCGWQIIRIFRQFGWIRQVSQERITNLAEPDVHSVQITKRISR